MRTLKKELARLCTLIAATMSWLDIAQAGIVDVHDRGPTDEWQPVTSAQLDEMRGGFLTPSGLAISFGIQREAYINGDLVTSTTFTPAAVNPLNSAQVKDAVSHTQKNAGIAQPAAAQAAAQGAQASAINIPVPANSGQGHAGTPVPAGGQPTPIARAQAGTKTQGQDITRNVQAALASVRTIKTAGGSVSVIQNGPGNTFDPGQLMQTAAATVIQNTLNQQSIRNLTIINASANSMEIARSLRMQTSLTEALTNALGSR